MEYLDLNNGIRMPALGLGVLQMNEPAACEEAVRTAIGLGYRLIDAAPSYGNEESVGRAAVASGVPREALFITSKLEPAAASKADAQRAFDASLARLGIDYLDLYLVHRPCGDIAGAWRALESLYEEGVVRAIGVSNFRRDQLDRLLEIAEIPPAVNQIEANVFFPQINAHAHAAAHEIALEAWAPLAEDRRGIFTNETLTEVGTAHGKTAAQVALRWLVQRGFACVPKAANPAHMAENLDIFDFKLTDKEMARIAALAE